MKVFAVVSINLVLVTKIPKYVILYFRWLELKNIQYKLASKKMYFIENCFTKTHCFYHMCTLD